MALFSMSFSIVQLAVPEELRGRVVSIYMVALRGGGPLGALVALSMFAYYSGIVFVLGAEITAAILVRPRGRRA